jgi:hypothetical protein
MTGCKQGGETATRRARRASAQSEPLNVSKKVRGHPPFQDMYGATAALGINDG